MRTNGKFCYLRRAIDHEGEAFKTVIPLRISLFDDESQPCSGSEAGKTLRKSSSVRASVEHVVPNAAELALT